MAAALREFRNGYIAEQGMHDELIQQNGLYAEIFRIRAHYYVETGGCIN